MCKKVVVKNNIDLLIQMDYFVYSEESSGLSVSRNKYENSLSLPSIDKFGEIVKEPHLLKGGEVYVKRVR